MGVAQAEPMIERPSRELLRRLRADLVNAPLTANQARYLVDAYYLQQEMRKRTGNQVFAMGEEEPVAAIRWLHDEYEAIEAEIRRVLGVYSVTSPVGRWAQSLVGIGPVLSAGLLAHIDIERAPTVGHICAFGGWNPTVRWAKGEKRPWNARLKVLFWKIGDSFVKTSGHRDSVYGPLYREAKMRYEAANERGEYADVAAQVVRDRPTHKQIKTYKAGHLPDGRIDLRARRVAVKIFLNHWHQVAYWVRYGKPAPSPYPIAHLGHAHEIPVPNRYVVPGF